MSLTPHEDDTLLLRACLLDAEAAGQSWVAWCQRVGAPRAFFERNITGLKGLLPFVQFSLQSRRIEADKSFATYLRAARLREELRLKIIREVVAEVLGGFSRCGMSPVLLRGYPLAETIYPEPCLRHCHGLHILVPDVGEAIRAVGPKFTRVARPMFAAEGALLKHSSRLPVAIYSRLVPIPGGDRLTALARKRTIAAEFVAGDAHRLAAADALVDICASAALSPGRSNLRWIVDAMLLLRSSPASVWGPFLEAVAVSRMALPFLQIFQYLRQALDAPIPPEILERLDELAVATDTVALEGIFLAARHGSRDRFSHIMEAIPDRHSRLRLIRALVLPRLSLLRWKYPNLPGFLAPTLFVWHPLSFVTRRMRLSRPPSDEISSEAV